MGYRSIERPPKKPNRSMQDTSTRSRIYVQNGATANLAIPCWYKEVRRHKQAVPHCRDHHDHIGWPDPHHPDHSCQAYDYAQIDPHHPERGYCGHNYVNIESMIPIHLIEEGYTDIEVVLKDSPSGITTSGYIDIYEDWVVRVLFDVSDHPSLDEDKDIEYAVFAVKGNIRDVVMIGTLTILAGPNR